ncbi:DUF3857 domain-containing transglutaminase family protein [Winogradskyella sp. PE311]|uniref:DUF3857 domain-containing transglutaminase family protein n=1 Tax=Winogradskyella sp. PE311 TaxID=3366943 RepID=UPI0039809D02
MTYKTINFYALLVCFFCSFNIGNSQIKVSNAPNWVVNQSYEKNPNIDLQEISYGLLTLLNDEQIHVPKKERYIRLVKKITDNVGVQDGSAISINYDPTYQQLILHNISVYRNGKTINKLKVNDFQTIRQESNAESYIYDGSLNAVNNLADIRNGDILDISYTIKGFNPIHKDGFSGGTSLNDFQPIGKINYYIIAKKVLKHKTVNTDIEPTIGSYKGYTTYHWQANLPKKPAFEDNMPSWYLTYNNVFVSNYEDWNAVVNWALAIYQDDVKLAPELQAKINLITETYERESERISATLKFVQDDIRYLGLESGIGAYKPFSPNKVLEQRFGDCKDKSWLMVTMLRQMGIEAYPVFANAVYGESLHQFLPSPKVFDHVVVNVIDSDNNSLFYDPTISNQFGYYKSVPFPDYGKVLVIKEGNNTLQQATSNSKDLVEVFDVFDIPTIGGSGTLKVLSTYKGSDADDMRMLYKSTSLSSISKDFKSYYENLYEGVEVIANPTFDDDSISNKIIVEEHYRINEIWQPMVGSDKNISVDFIPYSIHDVFISPDEKTRKTPYALYYPAHKKHHVTIKLPSRWNLEKDDIAVSSKNFEFSMTSKMNSLKDILYIDYEYENKNSYVKPEDFKEFYAKSKEVEQILSYYIYIPKSEAKTKPFDTAFESDEVASNVISVFFWLFGTALVIALILVVFVVYSNKKKDKY